jgi:Rrf2 family nitric oxide-sensitive transcriptional repressor
MDLSRNLSRACRKSISLIFVLFSRGLRVRLTVYTDYALRLLMYLALKDSRLATISEVAASYGISKNHLMKVAHQLGVAGYIETVRGRSGGLRLAQPVESIRLGEVVRRTEPDMALVTCFAPVAAPCAVRSCCVLRIALERAGTAFTDVLDGYSLADLVQPRTRLREALAIAPARPGRARSRRMERAPVAAARPRRSAAGPKAVR